MGTLISNEKLGINFEVKDLLQEDLEIYEHGMSVYLKESEYDGKSEAILVSSIVIGAIDAGFIPSDILSGKEELLNSKPRKISFLAARIAEIVHASKTDEVDFKVESPEITQGELERFEKMRSGVLDGREIMSQEMALANSIMVQLGVRLGWIPKDILKSEKDIPKSKPNVIRYLANVITEALTEARSISGE